MWLTFPNKTKLQKKAKKKPMKRLSPLKVLPNYKKIMVVRRKAVPQSSKKAKRKTSQKLRPSSRMSRKL